MSFRKFFLLLAFILTAELIAEGSLARAGIFVPTPAALQNNDDYTGALGQLVPHPVNEGLFGAAIASESTRPVTNSGGTTEYRIPITFGPFSQAISKLRIELGSKVSGVFVPLTTTSTNPPAGVDLDWPLQTPAPSGIPGMTTTAGQYAIEWNGNFPASTVATPTVYMDLPDLAGASGYSMTVRLTRVLVPEPGTLGLAMLGAMLIGYRRRVRGN